MKEPSASQNNIQESRAETKPSLSGPQIIRGPHLITKDEAFVYPEGTMVITVQDPSGMHCNIPWNYSTHVQSYMLELILDESINSIKYRGRLFPLLKTIFLNVLKTEWDGDNQWTVGKLKLSLIDYMSGYMDCLRALNYRKPKIIMQKEV